MTLMIPANKINKTNLVLTVLIFLFTAALYLPTLSNGFVYDDNFVVMQNTLIRGGVHISEFFFDNVWSFFSEDSKANFYRPLQLVLYRVEYAAFKLTPWPWHLVDILIHALNAALVYLLAFKVLPTMKEDTFGSDRLGNSLAPIVTALPALITALIFALHPANVEPVAWVSSVSDLLFTFFLLLGLLLYMKSRCEAVRSAKAYLFSLFVFALALLSKETAMALIPVIFVFEVFFRETKVTKAIKNLIPFIIIAIFYLILRTYALGGITQKEVTELSTGEALINILPLFFSYISKLLAPINLSVIYEVDLVTSVFALSSVAGFLLLSLFIFLFYRFRKSPALPFSLVFIVTPLAPILYMPAVSTGGFAERYLYLPTVGLALFVAYFFIRGTEEVALRHRANGAGRVRFLNSLVVLPVFVLLIVFFFSSTARMHVWKDDLTLWLNAVEMSPKSAIAHYNVGTVYVEDEKFPQALWHFQNAGRLDPHYAISFFNIGSIMARVGRFGDAVHYFKRSIQEDPKVDEYRLSLARAYMVGGKPKESALVLEELLKEKPDLSEAQRMLEEVRSQL